MSSNLRNCIQKLIIISKIKNQSLRKKVLLNLYDECLYKALYEVAVNTVSKNVPLKKKDKLLLRKHKLKIQKLACFTRNKQKRKSLISQSGGFLPILIPTIASILTSLITQ
jgi:hypothetical protein